MQQAVFQIVKAEYEFVKTIKIDPEYSLLVPILSDEEYIRLKESIADVGLYEPIVVNQDKVLLDGHHRLKVVKELGWEKIPVERKHFENRNDEEIYVIETNIIRRQLIDYQKTVLANKLEPLYAERAKQRMLAGVTLSSFELRGQSRDQAAKAVGFSPTTYHRAKTIMKEADENELKDFKKGSKRVYTIFKNIKTRKKIEDLNKEIGTLPPITGEYDTIVVDPPWDMDILDQGSWRGGVDYPRMSIDEIKAIKIPAKDLDDEANNKLKKILDISGSDKLIRFPDNTIAFIGQRFRRYEHIKYDDFTLRLTGSYGCAGELLKALEAFEKNRSLPSYYAYGHANKKEDGFIRMRVLDYKKFLKIADTIPFKERANINKRNLFRAYHFTDIPSTCFTYNFIQRDVYPDHPNAKLCPLCDCWFLSNIDLKYHMDAWHKNE